MVAVAVLEVAVIAVEVRAQVEIFHCLSDWSNFSGGGGCQWQWSFLFNTVSSGNMNK